MGLCGNWKIPIIGFTGAIGAGKTIFGLTIDDPDRTVIWDLEKSSESYEQIFPGLKRVDMHGHMISNFKQGYTPEQLYVTWIQQVHKLEPGKYTVGIVDPVSEIEAGLCEYVLHHPSEYGKTANQFKKGDGVSGLYWGVVKDLWKRHLMELSTKFHTFVFTAHLRQQYEANKPIPGSKEPKGLAILLESASLYLWLERHANCEVPSARVLKTRLVRRDENGVLRSILPPRIPKATPEGIRAYLTTPADFANLKPNEIAKKQELSEEDRIALRIAAAESEKEAAEAKLALAATIRDGGATMARTPAGELVLRKTEIPGGADKQEAASAP